MLADLGRSKESNGKYCFIHSIFAGSALIPSKIWPRLTRRKQ
ncbi:hypothetical protein CSC19_1851 [Enterobacter hormaechei]|nr:hypothetical protein CSC19_1851 [Enterobacter hormaechei]